MDPVPQTRILTHDVDLITLVIALIRARQPESKLVSSPCSAITLEYYSWWGGRREKITIMSFAIVEFAQYVFFNGKQIFYRRILEFPFIFTRPLSGVESISGNSIYLSVCLSVITRVHQNIKKFSEFQSNLIYVVSIWTAPNGSNFYQTKPLNLFVICLNIWLQACLVISH